MTKNIPGVLNLVVNNDICIGCGVCVYACKSGALSMNWNKYGFLVPFQSGNCSAEGHCLKVCPFNPHPEDEVKTEDELSDIFLKDSKFKDEKIGRYTGIYAGHSHEFRLTSSSGGIATYILSELLSNGIVDYVFSVSGSEIRGFQYEYSVIKSKQELLASSKTKYYPVTLATVLNEIDKLDGKIAIVGVGCFIKSIRLLQYYNPSLKKKIPFLVGIICGGVKSRFFTEYLSEKSGVPKEQLIKPEYRVKDINSTANDYSFRCQNRSTNETREIKMRTVGDMWGTGLFKANACDFCDDVTTELADVSLGDAWIDSFNKDGKGTNIFIARSDQAENILMKGILNNEIYQKRIEIVTLISSQKGSFNHRHKGLSFRTSIKNFQFIPIKRKHYKISIYYKIVQILRITIRKKSLQAWSKKPCYNNFQNQMKIHFRLLVWATIIYHYSDRIKLHFWIFKCQRED